jgi:hypothetical protein
MTISCLNIMTFWTQLVIRVKTDLEPSQTAYDHLIRVGHKSMINFFVVTMRWSLVDMDIDNRARQLSTLRPVKLGPIVMLVKIRVLTVC